MSLSPLAHDELIRYARHLALPQVGVEGQRRLKAARVLIVGAGGLGSPAALYLAAAGIGTLGLVDADVVDVSNLQRQVLHGTSAVGSTKLDSARARLHDLNPHVTVETFHTRLSSADALDVIGRFDVVVDGSDNFPTRYLVNDACVLLGKPNVYGAIFRFDGQAAVFDARRGPCYRCLYAEPPPPELVPSCAEGGVLGVLPGIIGSIQGLEAVKLVLGAGEPLIGRLLLVDGLAMRVRELAVRKDPECPVCGEHPTVTRLIDYEEFCGYRDDGRGMGDRGEISATELAATIRAGGGPLLVDVREPFEWEIVRLPGAVHVPLADLPARLAELDSHRDVVTYCHRGVRSLRAAEILRAAGFARVRSLRGGIDAWARDVERGMATY
jgi:adenylyltransferase/sulfurtransferase